MKSAPRASRFCAGSPQRSKAKPQTSRVHKPAPTAWLIVLSNIRGNASLIPASRRIQFTNRLILFAAPLVKNLPLAALVGNLFMVAYNMGDGGEIPEILK